MGGIWKQGEDHLRHDVDRHAGADRLPGLRRLLQQGRDPGVGLRLAQPRSTSMRSGCGILAAVLTAFYSGRLIWLTFHGEPRADHETMHHVHESPPVMTVPLMVLAVGCGARRLARPGHGRRRGRLLGRGDLLRRAQPRAARHARGAVLGEAGAVHRDGDRPGLLLGLLHAAAGPAVRRSRPWPARSTGCSTTSGTSTSSTTSCSCARPRRWATRSGAAATSASSTGSGRTAWRCSTLDTVRADGAAADRLRLPLRLRDADRRRGPGQLVPLRDCRVSIMGDWPLLSLVTFLPLVGVAFILLIRGDPDIVARNSRSVALWTSLVTFLVSLMVWANFDPAQPGFQLVEKSPVAGRARHQLLHGHRRHLALVRPAVGAADGRGRRSAPGTR